MASNYFETKRCPIMVDLNQFQLVHHALQRPLLVISNSVGCLSCGYLSLEAFERNGDAGAIVRGVDNHQQMLEASIVAVSSKAHELGVAIGMTGEQALEIYYARSLDR